MSWLVLYFALKDFSLGNPVFPARHTSELDLIQVNFSYPKLVIKK